ncbi:MAG: SPOR domain-containing protein [Geminicoccaceae bacterium]
MRLLIGLCAVCIFLLGFGSAVLVLDIEPPAAKVAGIEAAQQVIATAPAIAPAPAAEVANETRSSGASEPASPGVTVAQTGTAEAGPPPAASPMPATAIGLYGASSRADWVTGPGEGAGPPVPAQSAGAEAASLHRVRRPEGAFYTLVVADYTEEASAQAMVDTLASRSLTGEIFANGSLAGQDWYTVTVGRFEDRSAAERFSRTLVPSLGRRLPPLLLFVSEEFSG